MAGTSYTQIPLRPMLEVPYGKSRREKPRLIGYGSKSLPKACANYGITELEMTGLMYNMLTWKYWLGKKDFDAAVDHQAIPHIMKAKHPPTTDRIG